MGLPTTLEMIIRESISEGQAAIKPERIDKARRWDVQVGIRKAIDAFMHKTKATDIALEAAAKAIWETWCASPAGLSTAPDSGALTWEEMITSAETGRYPALKEMVELTRLEANNAVSAYEAARHLKT